MESQMKKQQVRILASMGMAAAMVLCAEWTGEREVLFPEIVALLTGAWGMECQPWHVGKIKLVLLMTLSAITGICFTRYCSWPLLIKIMTAYIMTGGAQFLFRCSIAPMISACILPILMGTRSMIYPVAVAAMSLVIIMGQTLMEQRGLREKHSFPPLKQKGREVALTLGKQTLAVGVIAAVPVMTKTIYMIAPPLLVLFTEFCNRESKIRTTPVRIWMISTGCALVGAIARELLCIQAGMSLTLASLAAITLVFAIFATGKRMFPPAGALSFLPFIIPEEKLFVYPAEVCAGAGLFILAAIYVVARDEKKETKEVLAAS